MSDWEHFEEKYGKPIGRGAQCRVFRCEDIAYKVLSEGHNLTEVLRESYALALVESLGVPTSNLEGVYKEAGHIVIAMRYVTGGELMETIIQCIERGDMSAALAHIDHMASIQIQMHHKPVRGLESTRSIYRSHLEDGSKMPAHVSVRMLGLLSSLPDGDRLCHNDFHPRNILYDGRKYTVIDWDAAAIGDPAGDVAHSYTATLISSKPLADAYLESYLSKSGMSRKRVERWIPFHAMVLYQVLKDGPKELIDPLRPFLADLLSPQ